MSRGKPAAALLAAVLWLFAGGTALAERLVISLSTHRVLINQNFTGVELTLFGTVEPDAAAVGRPGGGYTVVVTVIGPRESVVTWRKARVLGIWANAQSKTFVNAPSYLAVLSNRPIDAVAGPDILRRFRIGLAQFPLTEQAGAAATAPDDLFRAAFVAQARARPLSRAAERADVPDAEPVPRRHPAAGQRADRRIRGRGEAFRRGRIAGPRHHRFRDHQGRLRAVRGAAAREHSILYGLATAMLAPLTGWLGSVVFRRD